MRRRSCVGALRATSILILVPLLAACGAFRDLAGSTTAAGVDRGIGELAEEEQRDELARILEDRELRRETREAAAEIVNAAIDGAATQERVAAIEATLMRLGRLTGTEMGQHTGRSLAMTMVDEIDRALEGLTTEESRERIALLTRTVGASLADVMADGLREDVGPAVREVIRDDVAVGIEQALDERLDEALGDTARVMAREAVIGAGEGYEELREREDVGIVDRFRGALEQGEDLAQMLVFALGLLVGLLVGALVLTFLASRRARAKAEQEHDALLLVMSALKGTEGRPWSRELCDALREGMRDQRGGDVVRSVLRSRPDLRLCPGVREQLEPEERAELEELEDERSGIHERPSSEPRRDTGTD